MVWDKLIQCVEKFKSLGLDKVVDFEQFNRIAIVHHSSALEGSTLSLEETTLLITEDITAKGKSLNEQLMVKDHYDALLFTLEAAKNKTAITPEFLKQINALVNKNTGQLRNTPLGICNDAKGDFRLGNVRAGSAYFVNYDKVPAMVKELCEKLQESMKINPTLPLITETYRLSFDAHYYLVNIHPWYDGNGRTSRLLMNFIQQYYNAPLSLVFLQDKADYIKALNDTRDNNETDIFRSFMCSEQIKFLSMEIEKFEKGMI